MNPAILFIRPPVPVIQDDDTKPAQPQVRTIIVPPEKQYDDVHLEAGHILMVAYLIGLAFMIYSFSRK